jgi:hypothetical protein
VKNTPIAVIALALLGAAPACQAVPLDDYLTHGFEIGVVTKYLGTYQGCKEREAFEFQDGSAFICSRSTGLRNVVNPRVYMLRKDGEDYSVLLINDEPLDGDITSIHGRSTNYITSSDPPEDSEPASSSVTPPGEIEAITPIESITELQDEQTTRLNDAQAQPVLRSPITNDEKTDQERALASGQTSAGQSTNGTTQNPGQNQ